MNDELIKDLAALPGEWHDDPDHDGVQWRLDAEYDDQSVMDHVNGCDAYGRLMWVRNNPDTGYSVRPHEAGANAPHARVVEHDRGHTLWWWPEPEVWGTPKPWINGIFDDDYRLITRLITDGIAMAKLTRRTHCDCCDSALDESDYLGGIDVWPHDDPVYWQTIVSDMASELEPEPEPLQPEAAAQ